MNGLKYDEKPAYLAIQNKLTETLKICVYSTIDNYSVANTNGNFCDEDSKAFKVFFQFL